MISIFIDIQGLGGIECFGQGLLAGEWQTRNAVFPRAVLLPQGSFISARSGRIVTKGYYDVPALEDAPLRRQETCLKMIGRPSRKFLPKIIASTYSSMMAKILPLKSLFFFFSKELGVLSSVKALNLKVVQRQEIPKCC